MINDLKHFFTYIISVAFLMIAISLDAAVDLQWRERMVGDLAFIEYMRPFVQTRDAAEAAHAAASKVSADNRRGVQCALGKVVDDLRNANMAYRRAESEFYTASLIRNAPLRGGIRDPGQVYLVACRVGGLGLIAGVGNNYKSIVFISAAILIVALLYEHYQVESRKALRKKL